MEKHFYIKTEDEKPSHSEGVCSLIDNDFVLNYLNDFEQKQNKNNLLHSNFPSTNNLQYIYDFENNFTNYDKFTHKNENDKYNLMKIEENLNNEMHNQIEEENQLLNDGKKKKNKNNKKNEKKGKGNRNNCKNEIENIKKLKEIHENEELFNYRNNIKNTYINKINSLVNNTIPNNKIHYEEDNANTSSDSSEKSPKKNSNEKSKIPNELERLHKKLEKNRESARNSRKRKKIYIELLENKVAELSNDLRTTKKSLEFNKQQLEKMRGHTKHLNNMIQMKQQIYNKIGRITENNVKDENEINLLLDSLRLRLGATGKERVAAVNSLFRKISEIIVPGYIRFFLCMSVYSPETSIKHEKDIDLDNDELNGKLFNLEAQKNLLKMFGLSDNQKKYLAKLQKKLVVENSKIKQAFENLECSRKNLEKLTINLENYFDEMRNHFAPSQFSKFLLFVEREKKEKGLILSRFWDPSKIWPDDNNQSDFSDFSNIMNDSDADLKNLISRKKMHLNDN